MWLFSAQQWRDAMKSDAYLRGKEAWKLLDNPAQRDARIAELTRQLGNPTAKNWTLLWKERDLLTKARAAEHAGDRQMWCV